jgi:hypothetical protein
MKQHKGQLSQVELCKGRQGSCDPSGPHTVTHTTGVTPPFQVAYHRTDNALSRRLIKNPTG